MKQNTPAETVSKSKDKYPSAVEEANGSALGYKEPNDYLSVIINNLEDELIVIDDEYRIIEAN